MNLLTVSGIYKRESDFVLKDTSFTQQQFQKIAIAGETGSGKSTLLKIIAGIIPPDAGTVYFKNERVKKVPSEKLIPGHPGIAYLSQHFELQNNYRVEEVLSYTNTLTAKAAATLYEVCRIDHLLKRRTEQLSGGEKQRIALARLLVSSPGLLLLDEPFSNLDMIHKKILKSVIHDIGEKLQITSILVSHDPADTLSWADEILVMQQGKIIQQGTPHQIYYQPQDEYTAALFGKYNLISPAGAKVFYELPGITKNTKSLFIRPEHFIIAKESDSAARGTVQEVVFFGSYYEVAILLQKNIIIIYAGDSNIKKGDTVYVSLSPADRWYL